MRITFAKGKEGVQPRSTRRRRELLLMGSIVLVAFALRVVSLDDASLWHDEGLSWWFARQPLQEAVQGVSLTEHPPLYFLLLGGWIRLAGDSAYALRFLSVIGGVLTVAGVFALARQWRLTVGGLLAAAVLAVHPMHIWYSQEARSYSWMTFMGLVMTWQAWRWGRGFHWRDGVLYAVVAALGLYMHLFLGFLVLVHGVIVALPAWFQARTWKERVRVAFPFLLLGLMFVPWVLPSLTQVRTNRTYWYWGFLDVPVVLRQTALAFLFFEFPDKMSLSALRYAAYAAWGGVILGSLLFWRRPYGPLWVGSVWGILGLTLTVAYVVPKYAPRYVLDALPFWLLLLTAVLVGGVRFLGRRWGRTGYLVGSFVLGIMLTGYGSGAAYSLRLMQQPPVARPDFRQSISFVARTAVSGDAVVLVGGHMEPIVRYYLRREDVDVYPMPRRLLVDLDDLLTWWDVVPALERLTQRHRRIWLVRWQEDLADPQHLVYSMLQLRTCQLPTPPLAAEIAVDLFQVVRPLDLPDNPQPSRRVGIPFRNGIVLLGYDAAPLVPFDQPLAVCQRTRLKAGDITVAPGDTLLVVLYLQPTLRVVQGLTGFVHLVTPDGSRALGIMDRLLGGYAFPPPRWREGEIILQEFPVPVPVDTPPGEYALEVGLYYPETIQRIDPLPATVPGARTDGSRILIGPIYVRPR